VPPAANDPEAIVLAFVDCVNRGDVDGLGRLMSEDHVLRVLDEDPVAGRAANLDGWRAYLAASPRYTIHVRSVARSGGTVAILGHTTGSHLGLPDDVERRHTLTWLAEVEDGRVRSWTVAEDRRAVRDAYRRDA
jgi:ketosteroid isomerase-like protein